jgi:hypothetical protein
MTSTEVASLSVAVLSLFVSSVAAFWTYNLSLRQLRLGSRHEFQKLLLDLNKEMVRDPELWGVYDSQPMAQVKRDEPAHRAKLEAFAYMMLNIFDIVYIFSIEELGERAIEKGYFAAWNGTLRDFVRDSSLAKDLLSRPVAKLVFDPRFLKHAKSFIQN